MLGIEPWSRQRDILEAAATCPRVAVRSGHKVSKSCSAAGLALWWVSTRTRGQVVFTSSTDRQVRGILWKELTARHSKARVPIGGVLHIDPGTGLVFPDGRTVVGFTARDAERMAGFSGDELLFIVDEASGIDEAIFNAIEGNQAGGAHVLMFGNPTKTSGYFFDAFHEKREYFRTIHISSEETPNVIERRKVVPGLALYEWVQEKRTEWGVDSPLYAMRVRGNFPAQASNAVVGLAHVEAARARWAKTPASGPLVIGVDVARFGDDETVITAVRGYKTLRTEAISSMDTVDVAGRARRMAIELRDEMREDGSCSAQYAWHTLPRVQVDEIGVGAGVLDILSRYDDIEAVGVNVATKSDVPHEHPLLRDQLWFALADWLKEGGAILKDPKLEGELVAPTYKFDERGRRKVESKVDIKSRLGRSPDRADALALAIYNAAHSQSGEAIDIHGL